MSRHATSPIIGISCSMEHQNRKRRFPTASTFDYLKRSYYEAVERSGGTALPLPNTKRRDKIHEYLRMVDGVLVSGGNDVDPVFYGERKKAKNLSITRERDRFEIALVRKAKANRVPVFAICRGMQLVNVAFGGSLYQDFRVEEEFMDHTLKGSARYRRRHPVTIQQGSRLFGVMGKTRIMVNTDHHQMVKRVAPGFVATAWSKRDGVIEAIESNDDLYLLCVQWHPELMRDRNSKALFDSLVRSAKEFRSRNQEIGKLRA
ncbi:MAG: gamma-glutamyl-gamma-aminobutyrate hydrolase family protein [Candidatus Zixiibacteriota bacterium]|nr:MAG: gamma-glutamyl-gamma-aminobutyrate hydrolase family protein [candidate division Zixibacteria bacterium]